MNGLTAVWRAVLAVGILFAHCPKKGEVPVLHLAALAPISAVYDVVVVPPMAYVLGRGRLYVLDVSNPSAVRRVTELTFDAPRRRLFTRGSYLYLSGFRRSLAVIDISKPTEPRWIGSVPAIDRTLQIAGSEHTTVVLREAGPDEAGDARFSIDVLDLTDGERPRIQRHIDLGPGLGRVGRMHVRGRFATVVAGPRRNGLLRVDLETGTLRYQTLAADRTFVDVEEDGDWLFLLQDKPQPGLVIYRMEEGNPTFVAEITSARYQIPVQLARKGTHLYATFKGEVDLVTFDLSEPSAPRVAQEYTIQDLWAAGLGMALVNGKLFVAGDGGPMPIFDVGQGVPRQVGEWSFQGGWAGDVAIAGNLALIANVGGGMLVYDISNPQEPRRVSRYTAVEGFGPTSWQWSVTIAAEGQRAILGFENFPAELLDISVPARPVRIGRHKVPGPVHAVEMSAEHAFIGFQDGTAGGIDVVGLSSSGMTLQTRIPFESPVTDLSRHGTTLAVAHADGSISVLDVGSPAKPLHLSRVPPSLATSAEGRSTRLAWSQDGKGVFIIRRLARSEKPASCAWTILDLDDLRRPHTVYETVRPCKLMRPDVVRAGRYWIVFTGDLIVVDARDPRKPRVLSRHALPPARYGLIEPIGIGANDTHVLVGVFEDGVFVYRLDSVAR